MRAVYYSSNKHGDGSWMPAKDCRVDASTGRLLAFVSLSRHGIYPKAGLNPRLLFAANYRTSAAGRVWGCKQCIILAHPGNWLTKGEIIRTTSDALSANRVARQNACLERHNISLS